MIKNVKIGNSMDFLGEISFTLSPQITVFVGKNGVGKSLILEKFAAAVAVLSGKKNFTANDVFQFPNFFSCELSPMEFKDIRYEFSVDVIIPEIFSENQSMKTLLDSEEMTPFILWNEKCQYISTRKVIWKNVNGSLKMQGQTFFIAENKSLLSLDLPKESSFPKEFFAIKHIFNNIAFVRAGLPRVGGRQEEVHRTEPTGRFIARVNSSVRITNLSRWIISMASFNSELLKEFIEICRNIDISRDIEIKKYSDSNDKNNLSSLTEVRIDGINIGMLSDGTLRVLEIIRYLVSQPSGSLLIIEEPETGIHQGLLMRLINIIDSYSYKFQILISTHSSAILSKMSPKNVRFVSQNEKFISVTQINGRQISSLRKLLIDEQDFANLVLDGDMVF